MNRSADIPKRRRHDGLLVIAVTGAISVLIAVAVPIIFATRLMGNYHRFIQDLGDSLLYAREHGTLQTTVNGETLPGQMDQVERVYQLIYDTGMGSPLKVVPSGESLSFAFGDGSVLQVFPTTIKEADGTEKAGAVVSFTRADGHAFSYDTDQFDFEEIVSGL